MGHFLAIRNVPFFLIFQVFSNVVGTISSPSSSSTTQIDCTIDGADLTPLEKNHFDALKPILGKKFTVKQTDKNSDRIYTYYIGICTQPCPLGLGVVCDARDAVVQVWTDKQNKMEKRVVGRFNKTTIKGSDGWKMITYNGGDQYHRHCPGHSARRANLMLFCDETLTEPIANVLEENNQRNDSCYYLFEISGKFLCPPKNTILPEGVSAGSVIVILLSVAVSCYLIFGCLYRRIVQGAKGVDQMPNLLFWQNFGNLMADGCDYAFRTKSSDSARSNNSVPGSGGGYQPVTSSPGSRVYKGLGDDILSNAESNSADDSLLPM